ncbi:hypothetical protein BCF59_0491 [Mycoplasmopsis mustelae]|uniref:Uncharacterized protein n=1 Tax=Mycoplasmopsis mustelae TaxID=171289 RepID=A0A4R7UDU0_9BACT|nr:hypothetical protein [Mycoplasmopsis mustelae]TDV23502.1 hypothetical protein BCF59_0491 [Mycoplasmopsis mustelae]
MARINHINPRNYREPFLLVKKKIMEERGMQRGYAFYSKLFYASIIKNTNSNLDAQTEREALEFLSIKILNTTFQINNGDFIVRDSKVFSITEVDNDQFNVQEQKLRARYEGSISDRNFTDLKAYVDTVNDYEINKPLQVMVSVKSLGEVFKKDFGTMVQELLGGINEQINTLKQEVQELKNERTNSSG